MLAELLNCEKLAPLGSESHRKILSSPTASICQFEIHENCDEIFEWIVSLVNNDFVFEFCDYYYIIVFSSLDDASLFRLTWVN